MKKNSKQKTTKKKSLRSSAFLCASAVKKRVTVVLACFFCMVAGVHADGDRIMAKVTAVENSTVYLDKGSSHGVKPDMLFDIYREGKVVYIPTTREKVFVEEKVVAQAIVKDIRESSCTCHVFKLTHGEKIEAGDTAVNVNPVLEVEVNAPPVIKEINLSRAEAYAGEEMTLTCKIFDADAGDTFHIYRWSCDKGQLSAQETIVGEVRWLCPVQRGAATIIVNVTDSRGGQATSSRQIKGLGMGPRGKKFAPVASFGHPTPRFNKIACVAFDTRNHMLILDAYQKKLITLSDDFNVQRVSAFYGEQFSFTRVTVRGQHVYALDSKTGSLNRFKFEGDIFRRKPEVVYGAAGVGNGYFGKVAGVEVAPGGNVYILDSTACAIHVFTRDGRFLSSLGRKGNRPGEMRLPTAMAMDARGDIYVSDYARRKILKFNSDNLFVDEYDLGRKAGPPLSLCYNRRSDNLVILDRQNCCLYLLSTSGKLLRHIKNPAPPLARISDPEQLAVSYTGQILLVCENGKVLRRFSEHGDFLGKMGGEDLSSVSAFAVTPEGGLYLLDEGTYTVYHMDHQGWLTSKFGSYGSQPGQFQSPIALCSDGDGNAYVLDYSLGKVLKFSRSGKFLAAIGKPGSGKDELSSPTDIYSTGDNIYVLQNRSRHSVLVYNPYGKLVLRYPDKDSETSAPMQIAVDKSKNSFIFTGNYAVEFFNQEGARYGKKKTELWLTDLAADGRGDIYGTDPSAREIFRIDPAREGVRWVYNSTPAARWCAGIGFDQYGRMYLLDQDTKAIVRLRELVR